MTENTANLKARANMIFLMIENIATTKSRNVIKRKSVGSARNRTCQNHCRAPMICPKEVVIKARYAMITRSLGKRALSNYVQS